MVVQSKEGDPFGQPVKPLPVAAIIYPATSPVQLAVQRALLLSGSVRVVLSRKPRRLQAAQAIPSHALPQLAVPWSVRQWGRKRFLEVPSVPSTAPRPDN